jgi:hypothetical protein
MIEGAISYSSTAVSLDGAESDQHNSGRVGEADLAATLSDRDLWEKIHETLKQ